MSKRLAWMVLCAAVLAGCDETPAPPPTPRGPLPDAASAFDAKASGSIAGQVRWKGATPVVPPFRSIDNPLTDQPPPPLRDWPNVNAPRIDPATGGVASAVVFLRGVDPLRARPWNLPSVRIDLIGQQFRIGQGDRSGQVGFVRAGDSIDIISREDVFHTVHGRGSDYFARAFSASGDLQSRRLETPGIVELRSGSGYFWMRGYLHVSHHPYLAHVSNEGRFVLEQVPAGEYELVAWHPDWRVADLERNPDNFRVQKVCFRAPLESITRIRVVAGQTAEARLELTAP